MINLRFHVVSLISVFLALAVGIAVGATVVDQGLLQATRSNLDSVEQEVKERNDQIRQIEGERDDWQQLGTQGVDRLMGRRLRGVPVLVVTVKGIDRRPVDALVRDLKTAEADVVAQITLGPRLDLGQAADVEAARRALDAASTRTDTIRFMLHKRMRDAVITPSADSMLEPLRTAGLLESAADVPVPELPVATRVIVISGRGAELADDAFVIPWLKAIGESDPARVVAVEAPTPEPSAETPAGGDSPAPASENPPKPKLTFVNKIRDDDDVALRLSTVDDLDSLGGRVSVILAVEDIAAPVTGHYGIYDGADRLLPAPAS